MLSISGWFWGHQEFKEVKGSKQGLIMEGDNIGKWAVGFYVVALFLMSNSVLGQFVVEKNSISSESLKGKRHGAIGNFGVPDYGGTMIGQVLCPEKGKDGCKSFEELDVSFKKYLTKPLFVLVDRGCGFFSPNPSNYKYHIFMEYYLILETPVRPEGT